MQYKVYSRPPLPRNKYGFVNQSNQVGGNFSAYYGDGSSFNGSVADLIGELQDFTGATEYEDGVRGLVPAPAKGMQDYYFLKADGTWAYDPAYKWLHEWPSIGKPTGLEIDGDFNVTGTLNTMDLNVQGTAHFWELVIDRVKANGGQVIVSPSLFKVDWIGGTQIYELGFSFTPFTPYISPVHHMLVTDPVMNNQQDYTQWTRPEYGVDFTFGSMVESEWKKTYPYSYFTYFWNTTETNLGDYDKFRRFCNSYHLYQGYYSPDTGVGETENRWGQHITGYFDRHMTDEEGKLLPYKEGLPYDFEAHWRDYYHLLGTYDSDHRRSNGATYISITEYYTNSHGDTQHQTVKFSAMSRWLQCKYQEKSEEWAKAIAKRPDIYYRFFSTGLRKWDGNENFNIFTPNDVNTTTAEKFMNLPLDAEYYINKNEYYLGTEAYYDHVYWAFPSTDIKNTFGTNSLPIYGTIFNYGYSVSGGNNFVPRLATETDNVPYRKLQYFAKRIYMRCDDGTRRTENEVQIGDMLRCKSFNIKEGVYRNVSNNDFWSFVVGIGEEPYTDDNGVEYEAFYIDLVYAMKLVERKQANGTWQTNYRYYPIGTVFKNIDTGGDGDISDIAVYPLDDDAEDGVAFPSYWNQNMTQILELKKVSKNTLCGLTDVIEEFPTDEEFSQATDLILAIRGAITSVDEVTGTELDYSQTSLDTNTIRREQEIIAFVNDGDLPSSAGDLSQLVVDGNFSDDDGTYIGDELDDANLISFLITKGSRDGSDIDEVSDEGDSPTGSESGESEVELSSGVEINTEGRKLKLNETKHNYSSSEYYSQYNFGYGKYSLRVGDEFACLGNLYDNTRMNAIVISSVNPIDPELEAPSIAQYHLVDRFGLSISKFRYTTIAHNGNVFFGSFNIDSGDGAYLQIDEKINFYITDLVTGLETVGIHLDGENSTIKMIGNIELHQHADGDDDTLSIWDSAERKRVEMLPREIPNRTSQEAILAQTDKMNITTTYTSWTAPKNYIYYEETGSIVGGWFNSNNKRLATYALNINFSSLFGGEYVSSLPMFGFTVHTENSIGKFGREANTDKGYIDIQNINIKCDISDAYLLLNGETIRDLQRYMPITEIVGDNGYISNLKLSVWKNMYQPTNHSLRVAQTTISNPTYTTSDGKILNINLSGITFNDIELAFYGNTSLEYILVADFDVYPFCYQEKLKRSDYRSFAGNAVTNGTFEVVFDRKDGSGTSLSTGLSHMTIGTNGMVFNTSNSKYFYAADDGIEIKWDNAKLTFDDSHGIAICEKIISSEVEGAASGSIVFGNTGNYNLPSITEFGIGRRLTVINKSKITGYKPTDGSRQQIYVSVPITSSTFAMMGYDALIQSNTWDVIEDAQGLNCLKIISLGTIQLTSTNIGWVVTGGTLMNSVPSLT